MPHLYVVLFNKYSGEGPSINYVNKIGVGCLKNFVKY